MEFKNDKNIMIDMITQGADVFADASGFTIRKEEESGVAYQMNGLYPALFSNSKITGNELKLWLYLKSLENTQIKGAFPSMPTILETQDMSERTLIRTLKSMEKKKMIFILKRKWYDSGKQTSNLYFFKDYNKTTGEFYENGLDELYKKFKKKKALAYVYKDNSNLQMILLPDNK